MKQCIESKEIPIEGLERVNGFKPIEPILVNGMPYQIMEIEKYNIGVLACIYGADKILKYLLEELKMNPGTLFGIKS